ncbi:Mu-like prophage major head subunit gpT family protein [Zhongshania sp.]|uniref:phage major capsid protein n=1 Tax=Zhongshania sp. TaxID=1971902 RepID=UPI0035614D08
MTISSNSFAKALYPGVNSWYGKAYNEYSPEWVHLFETHSSSRAYEEDMGVTSFGLAQSKPEGQAISYDDESQAFLTRYSHVVYALGFIVTREAFEDDLYDVVGQRRAQGLAFSMRQTKEIVGANVYNRAFNASYTGGDGVSLINSAHPNFAGGTQSNTLAVAADLSEASLEQACIDIAKWTNDRGLKIALRPDKLIIPVDLAFEAERILKTPQRVGTANNDVNALYHMGKFPGGIVVNHYLTDTDAWFIRTNLKSDGLKHFQRRKMEFAIDNDFDTENAKFKASERYSFGWTDWRAIYGSAGA